MDRLTQEQAEALDVPALEMHLDAAREGGASRSYLEDLMAVRNAKIAADEAAANGLSVEEYAAAVHASEATNRAVRDWHASEIALAKARTKFDAAKTHAEAATVILSVVKPEYAAKYAEEVNAANDALKAAGEAVVTAEAEVVKTRDAAANAAAAARPFRYHAEAARRDRSSVPRRVQEVNAGAAATRGTSIK